MTPQLLILILLLGLAPAYIANGKGRSFILWWIYGIVLAPVALIHSVLLPGVGQQPGSALPPSHREPAISLKSALLTSAALFAFAVTAPMVYLVFVAPGGGPSSQRDSLVSFDRKSIEHQTAANGRETDLKSGLKSGLESPQASTPPAKPVVRPKDFTEAISSSSKPSSDPSQDRPNRSTQTAVPDAAEVIARTKRNDTAKSSAAYDPSTKPVQDAAPDVQKATPERPSKPPLQSDVTAVGEIVQLVQEALVDRGYDPGLPNGRAGKQTRTAILNFQSDRGLKRSGAVDYTLLEALGIVGPKPFAFRRPSGSKVIR